MIGKVAPYIITILIQIYIAIIIHESQGMNGGDSEVLEKVVVDQKPVKKQFWSRARCIFKDKKS